MKQRVLNTAQNLDREGPKETRPGERGSRLTIEKLKAYEGFEDMSVEEATEAISNIQAFARILFDAYLQDNKTDTDE